MRLTDEQIGAELRALRETPSERFAAELDAWAAEGFPSVRELDESTEAAPRARRRTGLLGFVLHRPALSALAGCAAVLLIVGGSIAAYLGSRGDDSTGAGEVIPMSAPPSTIDGSAKAGSVPDVALSETVQPQGAPQPRNSRRQVQELSASLGLSTDATGIQDAADGVVQVTNRYDGFVDSSDVHVGGKNSHASFTVRIPATHLRDALEDLSDLGRVTSRDEGSSNVTGAYVDAGKRYHQARANIDSLLEDLRNASSPAESAAIRQQLESARQELAAARAALGGVKQRVTYAPVRVQITAQGDGSWSIGDAA